MKFAVMSYMLSFQRIGAAPATTVFVMLLAITCCSSDVESYNVLLSGNFGEGSHYLVMRSIGESLVRKGHNVTFLAEEDFADQSRHPEDLELFHFEMFHHPGLKEKLEDAYDRLGYLTIANENTSEIFQVMDTFKTLNRDACKTMFTDDALIERLSAFDAIVFNIIWPCGVFVKSFLERHKGVGDIHLVALTHTSLNPYVLWEAGSPFFPSYQPAPMSKLSSRMSFFERLRNTLTYLSFIYKFRTTILSEPFNDLIEEYDLDPSLSLTMANHVDLYLINTDFSIDLPFAMMPSVIPVGGLTARPAKALNTDLDEFMESSGDHGVILFSLGSYLSTITTARPEVMQIFIDAFRRIPQKVIIQSKVNLSHDLPENIKVLPWLPLNDLLGHRKTRLLVYHGGNNGCFEAVYHGVPLVVMPLGGDQFDTTVNVVSKGIGVQLDKDNLAAETIYERVTEVLTQPTYSASVERISAMLRDRPMTAGDTSAYWIEHVIKHGGKYLKPSSLDMSFYQLYLTDVSLFFFLFVFVICWLPLRCIKRYLQRNLTVKYKQE